MGRRPTRSPSFRYFGNVSQAPCSGKFDSGVVVFLRRRKIAGRVYLYEVESYRTSAGDVRQRIVNYLGPEDPVYGTSRSRRSRRKS